MKIGYRLNMFEAKLSNGFDVIIHPTSAPVAALQVWVDVGSLDEKPEEAGFCHFLEHMLFKGTKKRTTAEIAGTVEGSGGDMNAFTSFEYTVYHITLSNERWKIANEILSDMVLHSTFLPKEFAPEKEVILEEIKRSDDSPDRQVYRGLYEQMYGKSGYGKPVIGFPRTVGACTAARLKSFWKKMYSPSLMTLVIAGNVDPAEAMREVEKTWGRVNTRPFRQRRRDMVPGSKLVSHLAPLRANKVFAKSKEFPVQAVRWVAATPACSVRDLDLPALDLSSMVLGQGEGSRLYKGLLRDQELVSSISSGVWSPAPTAGMYTFDAEIPVEKAEKFRPAFAEILERYCADGPTKDEIERAKVSVETDRVYGMQSMEGLAHRLGYLKTVANNPRFDLEYNSSMRELTTEDVRDSARKYLGSQPLREFTLTPKGKKALKSEKAITLGKPAVAELAKRRGSNDELVKLDGIDVILSPRPELPIVAVNMVGFGGVRQETPQLSGIGNVLYDVVEQGPKGWTATKFIEFLEHSGSTIESFTGRNSAGVSGTMLTRKTDEVLPLLLDTFFNPALDAEEFRRAQTLALEDIRTFEDETARVAGRNFGAALFEGHPYALSSIGTKDAVEALTIEKLKKYYDRYLNQKKLVFSISGKFNSNHVLKLLEGKFKEAKRAQLDDLSKPFPVSFPKAPRLIEVKKGREQSHVVIGFPGISVSDPSRFTLKMMLTVLGGQSGRLFREVRDKKGLCYTVAPMSFEGVETGYVGVYIGCDPTKRAQAIDAIWNELNRLQKDLVPAEEFKRAKEYLLGRQHMDIQQISSVSANTAFSALYGLGFDEYRRFGTSIQKETPAMMQKLARSLFSRPSVTSIVV